MRSSATALPGRARFRALLAALVAAALLALAPGAGRADASQVQSVSIEGCIGHPGCSFASSFRVDQHFGLVTDITVSSTISTGYYVYLELPSGTELSSPNIQLNYKGAGFSASWTMLSSTLVRIQIPISIFEFKGPITSESPLEIYFGVAQDALYPPAAPGEFRVKAWTSADTDPRESGNALTTTLGEPADLAASGGPFTVTVGGDFGTAAPVARLTDARGNPIPGKQIEFKVPESGPGGLFESGETATGETDGEGKASPQVAFAAGTLAGEWSLAASGPNATATSLPMVNAPGPAAAVSLEVAPSTIPADGSSEAEAKIVVEDAYDNPITTDAVELDGGGGPTASTPELQLSGSYEATLTASTEPGEYTVTATDATAELSDTATVTQTALPASAVSVVLEPAAIAADGSSTTTATATVRDELGAGVAGQEVSFATDGGNAVGPTVDHGDGTYTATVTSTTTPGTVTVSAVDSTPVSPVEGSATLTQSALPAPAPAPRTKILAGPKGRVHAARVAFRFAARGGTAARFECRLDHRAWARCRSPKAYRVSPGRHVFRVRAYNSAGVAGPIAKRGFKRVRRTSRA